VIAVKVAAWQAPLLPAGSMQALHLIQVRVAWCEAEGISILCCPEAILGGLADYSESPGAFAIDTRDGRLDTLLAPLASHTVTTIVGFTEVAENGRLYNAAAVFERGAVTGIYRKLHPAIRRSVYHAGTDTPVFRIAGLTFGIVICNDSNFPEPARLMAGQGAVALFIPSNNGLPAIRSNAALVDHTRSVDIAMAVEHSVWVIRADVAGDNGALRSYGSSSIVDPRGTVIQSSRPLSEDLIFAEIGPPSAGYQIA